MQSWILADVFHDKLLKQFRPLPTAGSLEDQNDERRWKMNDEDLKAFFEAENPQPKARRSFAKSVLAVLEEFEEVNDELFELCTKEVESRSPFESRWTKNIKKPLWFRCFFPLTTRVWLDTRSLRSRRCQQSLKSESLKANFIQLSSSFPIQHYRNPTNKTVRAWWCCESQTRSVVVWRLAACFGPVAACYWA